MREIYEAELLAYHESICASSSFPSSSQGSSAQLAGSSSAKLKRRYTSRTSSKKRTEADSDNSPQVGQGSLHIGSELSEYDLQRYHEGQPSFLGSSSRALPSSQTGPPSSPTKAPKTKRAAPRRSQPSSSKRARKNPDSSTTHSTPTSPPSPDFSTLGHITLVEYDDSHRPDEVYELDETPRAETFQAKSKARKKPTVPRTKASVPAPAASAAGVSVTSAPILPVIATPDTHISSSQTDTLGSDTPSGTPSGPDTPLAGKGSGARGGFAALLFGSKGDGGGGGLGLKRLLPTWVVSSPAGK